MPDSNRHPNDDVTEPEQGQAMGEESDLEYRDLAEQDEPPIDVDMGSDAGGEVLDQDSDAEDGDSARRERVWIFGLTGLAGLAVLTLLWVAGAAVVLVAAGAVLYDYGTMQAPSATEEAQYQQLVSSGQAEPLAPAPGFRIAIPGCVCHAADPNIASKVPGRQPDVTIVMAHRYRTLSQCGDCHGNENEPSSIEGQPLEDSPPQ